MILILPSDIISTVETDFLHNLSLTDRKVTSLFKVLVNILSMDTKFSKMQLSKIIRSSEFLSRLFGH